MSDAVWIWGRRPVLEALRAGTAVRVLLATGRQRSPVLQEIEQVARERGVTLQQVPPTHVERLAPGQNAQGVAAQVVERHTGSVEDLLAERASHTAPPFLLALDQIQDPHNVGALLRSADATGVQGVIQPARRSAGLTGTVAKASAGALHYLPILTVTNLAQALTLVREAGIWTVGLDGSAGRTIFDVDLTVPLTLVVGSEGSGLRRLTRERCDFLVRLPMVGAIESLNVSVAGGVAMYEVLRQRLEAARSST